jgi:hypothetical protein
VVKTLNIAGAMHSYRYAITLNSTLDLQPTKCIAVAPPDSSRCTAAIQRRNSYLSRTASAKGLAQSLSALVASERGHQWCDGSLSVLGVACRSSLGTL